MTKLSKRFQEALILCYIWGKKIKIEKRMNLVAPIMKNVQQVHRTKNEVLLRISSVNVTKSPGNCGFGQLY